MHGCVYTGNPRLRRAIGTLEAGKEADLAIVSQDIFTARSEEIGKTKVVLTMVGGKMVFGEIKLKRCSGR
jgi:predicted amidohydrolase YtcJ